jgi:hypothetical protein
MMGVSLSSGILMPPICLVFFIFDPDLILNITSFVPIGREAGPWRLLAAIPTFSLGFCGWAIVLVLICGLAPYIFISIFLTSELK